jgi:hypothetical protein
MKYPSRFKAFSKISTIIQLRNTSGFWPRVRARALRTPVFFSSLPCQTGRCAPPPRRPSQLCCYLFDPQKYIKSIEFGSPAWRAFFFQLYHRGQRVYRVPGLLSSRPNWVPPPPHLQESVVPPPLDPRGETHSLSEGVEGINSDDGAYTLVHYVYMY